MRPANDFKLGDRVILLGDWEFPDGTTGVISEPAAFLLQHANSGEWVEHQLTTNARNGPMTCYHVMFDQPTDDGSGDGPYLGAVVNAALLRPAPLA